MPRVPKQKTKATTACKPYCVPQKLVKGTAANVGPLGPVSVDEMREINATNREEYGWAKETLDSYKGYIKQGKKFLAECVRQRACEKTEEQDTGPDINLLAKAFENPPNKTSAEALELFIVQKCFREHCGESVANSIQAAFAWHWDTM